jgi:hypothetical protein
MKREAQRGSLALPNSTSEATDARPVSQGGRALCSGARLRGRGGLVRLVCRLLLGCFSLCLGV